MSEANPSALSPKSWISALGAPTPTQVSPDAERWLPGSGSCSRFFVLSSRTMPLLQRHCSRQENIKRPFSVDARNKARREAREDGGGTNKKARVDTGLDYPRRMNWWSRGGSNPWPRQCDCRALPAELRPQKGQDISCGGYSSIDPMADSNPLRPSRPLGLYTKAMAGLVILFPTGNEGGPWFASPSSRSREIPRRTSPGALSSSYPDTGKRSGKELDHHSPERIVATLHHHPLPE